MSISDRLWDDQTLGTARAEPQFVGVLITVRGVANRAPSVQSKAIAEWLEDHNPSPTLRRSIAASTFRSVLDRRPQEG